MTDACDARFGIVFFFFGMAGFFRVGVDAFDARFGIAFFAACGFCFFDTDFFRVGVEDRDFVRGFFTGIPMGFVWVLLAVSIVRLVAGAVHFS